MARSFGLVVILVTCWGGAGISQDQPPPLTRTAPAFPGAPPGGIRGRGGPTNIGPAVPTESSSRSSAGMMSRPMPASVPLPTKIGKALSFDVLIAARAEPVESATAGKILELEKAGKLDSVNRLQLATLEEMPAFVQFGALKARVSGRTATNVTVLPIYNDINLGSILQVTARVAEDGAILAQIYFEQSFLDGGEEGAFNPQDHTPPKAIARQLTQTTVRLKPGEPLMIGGHQAGVGQEASQSWIVVTARVGE